MIDDWMFLFVLQTKRCLVGWCRQLQPVVSRHHGLSSAFSVSSASH